MKSIPVKDFAEFKLASSFLNFHMNHRIIVLLILLWLTSINSLILLISTQIINLMTFEETSVKNLAEF